MRWQGARLPLPGPGGTADTDGGSVRPPLSLAAWAAGLRALAAARRQPRCRLTGPGRREGSHAAWGRGLLLQGRSQASEERELSRAAALGLGLAAAALAWQRGSSGCEAAPQGSGEADVRVVTYNLLSPPLASTSHFPACAPEDVDHTKRFPKILARLEREIDAGAVLGLQEVDLGWAGQLHAFFAERGYVAVFAQYGKAFNGYMGVMLAWPRARFEVEEVEISRLSDTAPGKMWPKPRKAPVVLNPYGFLTKQGLKDVLGCWPPVEGPAEPGLFEWNLARDRFNEAIFARLRPRGAKPGASSFVVSTYHMPCLFGSPEKVRVVNIHAYLLLSRLRAFAGEAPAILLGDFNVQPGSSPYELLASGGSLDAAARAPGGPAELWGLGERLPPGPPWPTGLASAYCRFHGKEPLFTNYAQVAGQAPFVETLDYIWFTPGRLTVVACPELPQSKEEVKGPFPNGQEPSDHMLLAATLRLGGIA